MATEIDNNKKYRDKLVHQIKDAGQELINRAETMVHPDIDLITDFYITLSFSQDSFHDVWRDFIVMYACALSNPIDKEHYDEREALYLRTIKKYNKQEQPLFSELAAHTVMALEENPEQDFLGSIFMSLNLGNQHNGQFFTPYHVCELMAEVTMQDSVTRIEEDGYITINDPCCGAGATLIAGVHAARKRLEKVGYHYQNHILVVAQDIDQTVALMCYIQLSLLGVAGYIKVGNSLTDPITENDSKENYWFTPMYFFPTWSTRRLFGGM